MKASLPITCTITALASNGRNMFANAETQRVTFCAGVVSYKALMEEEGIVSVECAASRNFYRDCVTPLGYSVFCFSSAQ